MVLVMSCDSHHPPTHTKKKKRERFHRNNRCSGGMQTVCSKMKTMTSFASVLFLSATLLSYGDAAKRQQAPRKEASTTFLRLTALRSDEGLWTARFGDYEISIELKHHPTHRGDCEYNDTWTLKLKHSPKRFFIPEEKLEPTTNEINRDIIQDPSFQTSETRETWKQIADSLDDNDEDDSPVFKKMHSPSNKKKKAKTRRQLSTKTYTSTTEKTDFNRGEAADAYTNEPIVLTELAQGSNRINVFFNNTEESINEASLKPEYQFEEVNEKPWNHIAAVIYQGMSRKSIMNDSAEESTMDTPERLSDSFASPLQQTRLYDNMLDIPLDQDTGIPHSYNPDNWVIPEDVIVEGTTEQASTNGSEEIYDATILEPGISYGNDIVQPLNASTGSWEVPKDVTVEKPSEETDKGQREDYETDYVIEDTMTEKDDDDDDDDDENVGSEAESSEVDFSKLEVPPEMKRIMEWYPRSKPLSTLNNGYKLFPGVGWFKFVPWAERWSNAKKVCESEKAFLAIPDTKQKVKIFLQIFRNFPDVLEQSILSNQAYVGVYSRGMHRNMTTVLEKPFQPRFPVWFPGEPDNADPGEDCVTFHAEGKIRDVPCFYNLPFLCEKEPDIS